MKDLRFISFCTEGDTLLSWTLSESECGYVFSISSIIGNDRIIYSESCLRVNRIIFSSNSAASQEPIRSHKKTMEYSKFSDSRQGKTRTAESKITAGFILRRNEFLIEMNKPDRGQFEFRYFCLNDVLFFFFCLFLYGIILQNEN